MSTSTEMRQVPLVDLGAQYDRIRDEIDEAIQRVLDHHGFILGDEVRAFEAAFAEHVGADEAVGVASGTAALHLALQACEIGPGDAVAVPSHTFFATAEAVSNLGAEPVFVDVESGRYTLDPGHLARIVEERDASEGPPIRAVLPVHLYGQPADMELILEIAREHGLRVVEDAAQAHGAEYRGKRCGSLADLACFSFYPDKNLGAYGDGGAVTGDDPDLLDRVRRLRDHGRTSKYEHVEVGWEERLDALQAAVLEVKLGHLEDWTERRRRHADAYRELLVDADVELPEEEEDVRHVYHLFVIQTGRRDELHRHLRNAGIGAGIHYPLPVHLQPAYRENDRMAPDLEVTERLADEVLSLPMYPELEEEDLRYVARAVKEGLA